ncbi:hypothetical protein C1646_665113 [Rhizophagus diaphanus]|nr:hypothetical protein C1646_665113 [Rhizophagus diaphanus] [Rhizophagus sp. MUCL 43196]
MPVVRTIHPNQFNPENHFHSHRICQCESKQPVISKKREQDPQETLKLTKRFGSDIEDNEIDSEEDELNDTNRTKKNKYSHLEKTTLNGIHFGLQNIHGYIMKKKMEESNVLEWLKKIVLEVRKTYKIARKELLSSIFTIVEESVIAEVKRITMLDKPFYKSKRVEYTKLRHFSSDEAATMTGTIKIQHWCYGIRHN